MEGEEVDWEAGVGGADHHIPAVGPLVVGVVAPVIVDVVGNSRPTDHCIRITFLQQEGCI